MKIIKQTILFCLVLACGLFVTTKVNAKDTGSITCYGEDLSSEQFKEVVDLLGTDLKNDHLISVTIEEEKELLGSSIDVEKLGTRSITSVRVTPLADENAGITVTTHNINWVTAQMYSNALATAGVTSAKIVVAAPVEVSGTSALSGIFKAYGVHDGEVISQEAKEVATNEMMLTGQLADIIGSQEAVELMALIKNEIATRGLDKEENLRPYVVETAKQMGLSLTQEQIDSITSLGVRIAKLDIDPEKISKQIEDIGIKIKEFEKTAAEAVTWFENVKLQWEKMMAWFEKVFNFNQN